MEAVTRLTHYLANFGYLPDDGSRRELLEMLINRMMDIDVGHVIDAEYYERSTRRAAYRNGYRQTGWNTAFGRLALQVPKLRNGTYYPHFLNDELIGSLNDALNQAWGGLLTTDVLQAIFDEHRLGQFDYSDQINLCDTVQRRIKQLQNKPIRSHYPYLLIDVIDLDPKAYPRLAAAAIGVTEDGKHEVIGLQHGASAHDEDFWLRFVRSLVKRGLNDVRLVISDLYHGLKIAIYEELIGAEWQYCHTRFLQDLLEHVDEAAAQEVTDAISSLFLQSNPQQQLQKVVKAYKTRFPKAMAMLETHGDQLLSFISVGAAISNTDTLLRVKESLDDNVNAVSALMLPDFEAAFSASAEMPYLQPNLTVIC